MKIVIASGGMPPSYDLLYEELKEASYLICADSGANYLYEYNICPDILIGDFDSIDIQVLNYFKDNHTNIIQYPPEKDYTDTEIAVNKALELNVDEIVLLGCTGTRIDHFLGNLGMLLKCLSKKVTAYIKDEHNTITIADKSLSIFGSEGETFSLAAYSENVENLTISGAKYPLNNYYLEIGSALTISNEFQDKEVKINFDEGILLIIYSRD
ncbi:thiamine diphosphokinase [Clostridium ganghwense]|uniref:Thiamine diphosphokinase n=1 Tax=Clostridium ganghwense TaxID=312089 RepID=A0ABT4CTG3_9CLOT|nr:thiamine diphosphokinase [Clostridium ganghwense]MCY6372366.1 thiamine diphosphokinase [Clostridium ganghwense]